MEQKNWHEATTTIDNVIVNHPWYQPVLVEKAKAPTALFGTLRRVMFSLTGVSTHSKVTSKNIEDGLGSLGSPGGSWCRERESTPVQTALRGRDDDG